jgi:hypothetical protein
MPFVSGEGDVHGSVYVHRHIEISEIAPPEQKNQQSKHRS